MIKTTVAKQRHISLHSVPAKISLLISLTLAIPANAEMYVSTFDELRRFDQAGNLVETYPLASGTRMLVGSEGTLFRPVIPTTTILEYSPKGILVGQFAEISGFNLSGAIVFDAAGNILVGVQGNGSTSETDSIEKLAPDGLSLGTFAEISSGSSGAVFDMEFDSQGRLYATDDVGVERFDSDGNSLGLFVGQSGSIITQLEFDSEGNLYLAYNDRQRIDKYDTDGNLIAEFNINSKVFALEIHEDILYVGAGGSTTANGFIDRYDTNGQFLGNFVNGMAIGNPADIDFVTLVPEPNPFCMLMTCGVFVAVRQRLRRPHQLPE